MGGLLLGLRKLSPILFFFFFFLPPYPRSTQHKDRWISGPAVRHIGSSTLLTVLKCLWELMEHFSCSSLSQPNPICAEQISCGVALTVVLFRQIHIYKKSNHCLYCLFRMICVLLYVLHLLPCWKAQKNTNRVLPLFTKCTVMPLVIAVDNSIHWHGGRRAAQSPKKKKKKVCHRIACHAEFSSHTFFTFPTNSQTWSGTSAVCHDVWLRVRTCIPMLQSESDLLFVFCRE